MGDHAATTTAAPPSTDDLGAQVQTLLSQGAGPASAGAGSADLARQVEALLSGENKPGQEAPATEPAPQPAQAAPAPAQASGGEPRPKVEGALAPGSEEKPVAQGAALRLAGMLSKPLEGRPPAVRVAVGVIAINTLVLAGFLWAWVFFRPREVAPGRFDFSSGTLPAAPRAESGDEAVAPSKAEGGKPNAKNTGAKGATKKSAH